MSIDELVLKLTEDNVNDICTSEVATRILIGKTITITISKAAENFSYIKFLGTGEDHHLNEEAHQHALNLSKKYNINHSLKDELNQIISLNT